MTQIEYFYIKLSSFSKEFIRAVSTQTLYGVINAIEAYETDFHRMEENQYIGNHAVQLMLDHLFQIISAIDKSILKITPENITQCIWGAFAVAIKFNYGYDHKYKISNDELIYYCGIPENKLKEFNNWERKVLIAIDHTVPKVPDLKYSAKQLLFKVAIDQNQIETYLKKAEKVYKEYLYHPSFFGIGATEKANNIKIAITNVRKIIAKGKTFDSISGMAYFKMGDKMAIHEALNSPRILSIKSHTGDRLLKEVTYSTFVK